MAIRVQRDDLLLIGPGRLWGEIERRFRVTEVRSEIRVQVTSGNRKGIVDAVTATVGADGIAAFDEVSAAGYNYRTPGFGVGSAPLKGDGINAALAWVSSQLYLISASYEHPSQHISDLPHDNMFAISVVGVGRGSWGWFRLYGQDGGGDGFCFQHVCLWKDFS